MKISDGPFTLFTFYFSLFTLTFGLAACTSSPKTTEMADTHYEVLMAERLGDGAVCEPNADASFMLCSSVFMITAQTPGIKFFVYDVQGSRVTYESDVNCNAVQWVDSQHVEVMHSPGTVQKNATSTTPNSYLIDARSGEVLEVK